MKAEWQIQEETYDAGLLPDPPMERHHVEWWQDAMRAELRRAHDFYTVVCQEEVRQAEAAARAEEREKLTVSCERYMAKCVEQERASLKKVAQQEKSDSYKNVGRYSSDGKRNQAWREGVRDCANSILEAIRARNG